MLNVFINNVTKNKKYRNKKVTVILKTRLKKRYHGVMLFKKMQTFIVKKLYGIHNV
jgi:hypothetical protein